MRKPTVSPEKDNVVELPILSADKLEDMAVEADEQLSKWIDIQLDSGISAYTVLGILSINPSDESGAGRAIDSRTGVHAEGVFCAVYLPMGRSPRVDVSHSDGGVMRDSSRAVEGTTTEARQVVECSLIDGRGKKFWHSAAICL